MATTRTAKSSRKGRPNYPLEFKRKLAALACDPEVSVAKLAAGHGLNANVLFRWRRQYLEGYFGALDKGRAPVIEPGVEAKLLPVVASAPRSDTDTQTNEPEPYIEICVGVFTVRVHGAVSAVSLRTVLECLARR